MVRDRQEESEDFYPSSVPTLKGNLDQCFQPALPQFPICKIR